MASEFAIPTFKECAAQDIKATFLCASEFAEEVEYDGVKVLAVVTNNDAREPITKETDALGLYKWDICLHVAAADLPHRPEQGEYIRLNDGRLQYVAQVEEEMGMYLIYLTGNM